MIDGEDEDGELLLVTTVDDDGLADDQPPSDAPAEEEFPDSFDEQPEGDPGAEAKTPLIRQLRDELKEKARRERDLQAEIDRLRPAPVRVKKPDLWDDCEGDPDKFEAALTAWQDGERQIADAEKAQAAEREKHLSAWNTERQSYRRAAVSLAKPDYDEAEDAVCSDFSESAQATIIMAASSPQAAARMIYALGRSPAKRAELVALQHNPIKLAAAIARLEGSKPMARKEPPQIDTPLRGSARLSASVDKHEQKLEADADKSGDRTALVAYRREKRLAAR